VWRQEPEVGNNVIEVPLRMPRQRATEKYKHNYKFQPGMYTPQN